ncbi:MAG: hypothetical protein ACI4QZ_09010, partial [Eubacteriales bacterium]
MKKNKFQRSTALFLALITVIGSLASVVSAAVDTEEAGGDAVISLEATAAEPEKNDSGSKDTGKGSSSVSDKSIEDVRELLNAISYDEYSKKYAGVPRASEEIMIEAKNYDTDKTDADVYVTSEYAEKNGDAVEALYIPSDGTVTWKVNIPTTAKYSIKLEYYPVAAKSVSIQRIFRINGKVPFAEARYITMSKVWLNEYEEVDEETGRKFKLDIDRNELRPSMSQAPEWRIYEFKDLDGFYSESFEFVFEAGENEISFESVSEPMAISHIYLVPHVDHVSYEEVRAEYEKRGLKPADSSYSIKIEAEEPEATSSQTVYPIE